MLEFVSHMYLGYIKIIVRVHKTNTIKHYELWDYNGCKIQFSVETPNTYPMYLLMSHRILTIHVDGLWPAKSI